MKSLDYLQIFPKMVEEIHLEMRLQAHGFNSEGNFEFIFNTIDHFPELAGIIPENKTEKIAWVASYLLFHLAKGHCFNDGNKRTAFVSMELFLDMNGMRLDYDYGIAEKKMIALESKIDQGLSSLEAIQSTYEKDNFSNEYQLTVLLFGLCGVKEFTNYDTPLDVFPILRPFIISQSSKDAHSFLREER